MTKVTPEFRLKFEFFSIFLNNVVLFLGLWLFGWSLFATLFLVWLELIAAVVLLNYLKLVIPIKYGRPGMVHLEEYRRPALKVLGLSLYTVVLHTVALLFLISIDLTNHWDTSQGIVMTLVQLPGQLWAQDLLLLSLLFLVVYLAPAFLLEKQGIIPQEHSLPMSARIMTRPSQFIMHYVWFGLLYVMHCVLGWEHPILLVGILMLCKSVYEALLFFRTVGHDSMMGY